MVIWKESNSEYSSCWLVSVGDLHLKTLVISRVWKIKANSILHGKKYFPLFINWEESPCVVAYMLDSDIKVNEFKLPSYYYIHFQTNTLRKGMNPLILSAMG